MAALPPRRPALLGLLALSACGPRTGELDGDGSGGTSASDIGGQHASGSDASGSDASGTADETGEAGDPAACPQSDLPDPFCHVFVPTPPFANGRLVGYVDQVRDGVRPLLLHDQMGDDMLRLISPLDHTLVLEEARLPSGLPLTWEIPVTADFNGDGVHDFAAYDPGGGIAVPHEAAIIDGETFEVIGALREEPPFDVRSVSAVDVDGDGTSELISIERDDGGLLIDAWRPADGGTTLVQRIYSGLPASDPSPDDILRGDFNGDGKPDLAITWHDGTEPYWFGEGPRIFTILGAASPRTEAVVIESPQPVWARSAATADMDGDGDHEVVIAYRHDEIALMDWKDGGFVFEEMLALPEEYTSGMTSLAAGRFGVGGIGALLVADVNDGSTLAFFPPPAATSAIPQFPGYPSQSFVADFNADGIDDFRGGTSEHGLYVSVSNP